MRDTALDLSRQHIHQVRDSELQLSDGLAPRRVTGCLGRRRLTLTAYPKTQKYKTIEISQAPALPVAMQFGVEARITHTSPRAPSCTLDGADVALAGQMRLEGRVLGKQMLTSGAVQRVGFDGGVLLVPARHCPLPPGLLKVLFIQSHR